MNLSKEHSLMVLLPPELEQQIYQRIFNISLNAIEATKDIAGSNKQYYNQKELCQLFNCGTKVIGDWEVQGLKSFQKGREKMYDIKDVRDFLDTIKK